MNSGGLRVMIIYLVLRRFIVSWWDSAQENMRSISDWIAEKEAGKKRSVEKNAATTGNQATDLSLPGRVCYCYTTVTALSTRPYTAQVVYIEVPQSQHLAATPHLPSEPFSGLTGNISPSGEKSCRVD